MIANGIYRMEALDGAEIAKVAFGRESPSLGEINRDIYEENGCKPPFESLPTKEEYEAYT